MDSPAAIRTARGSILVSPRRRMCQSPGGQTPGEAAGIHVDGDNPWLIMIQSAAKFSARLAADPPG